MDFSLLECSSNELLPFAPFHLTFSWDDADVLQHVDIVLGTGSVTVEGSAHALQETKKWLRNYFKGKSYKLSHVPLTALQQHLFEIPFGKTTTYGEIAASLGNKNAARGVGRACGANPIPLVAPCHRVLAKNGKLCGFNRGPAIKEALLLLEQQIVARCQDRL